MALPCYSPRLGLLQSDYFDHFGMAKPGHAESAIIGTAKFAIMPAPFSGSAKPAIVGLMFVPHCSDLMSVGGACFRTSKS
jgi:hypothetical protein